MTAKHLYIGILISTATLLAGCAAPSTTSVPPAQIAPANNAASPSVTQSDADVVAAAQAVEELDVEADFPAFTQEDLE